MRLLNRTAPLLAMVLALSCVDIAPPTAAIAPAGATAANAIVPNSATHVIKAALPTPRYLVSGEVLGDKLYVMGGSDASFAGTNLVERYDPGSDSWATMAPLPEVPQRLYTATIGNFIYARTFFGSFFRYNASTNSWQARAFTEQGYGGAAASNGRYFYYVGGYDPDFVVTTRFARYDTLTNAWTTLAPIPTPLISISAARLGSKIYVVGGFDFTGSPVANELMYIYDINANSWSFLPTPIRGHVPGLTAIADKLYSYGGGFYNTAYGYDPANDTWTVVDESAASSPTTPAVGAIGSTLHVVGGSDGGGATGTHHAITVAYAGAHAPQANAGGPYTGKEGASVAFDGSASSDADGEELTYSWNFGDGTVGSGATPTHTYADNGTYNVSLAVKDPTGRSSARVWTGASIGNKPPVITLSGSDTVIKGDLLGVQVDLSDPGSADQFSLKFEFGDGRAAASEAASEQGSSLHYLWMTKGGTYTLRVTARDDDGGIGVAEKRVRVLTMPEAITRLRNMTDAMLAAEDRIDVDRLLTLAKDHAAAGHNVIAADRIVLYRDKIWQLYLGTSINYETSAILLGESQVIQLLLNPPT